ncbi:UNVERIFIED_ORG: enamine deaminase RidA (YjgF/YER057c/UK114 family) [Zoogloea ramigera]|uniref:RidA family protein n=1 Tax=Duganella zoogloeoides TaxID=75659 RepID=A0ABZ0XY28_9BURK|nr:RidA family protein [Duganella zoogloeoides]WQH04353.1 RidA family protein [Duganella zoogloeoides]
MQFINPATLYDPRPNGYTHVVIAEAPARLVYIAGQGGEDVNGVLSEDFATQVAQALVNLRAALQAADTTLAQVAKVTALIVGHDEAKLAIFSTALRAAWGDAPPPACTLIPVPRLALDGMLFEIEATVVASLLADKI